MPEREPLAGLARREGEVFFHDHQESEAELIFPPEKRVRIDRHSRWQSPT